MPFSRVPISSARAASASVAVAAAFSSPDRLRSRAFFLSSAMSNCLAQYSFLCSSSSCSFCSTSTMLSHILMTLSNPPRLRAFLLLSASTRKSRPARWSAPARCRAARSATRAFAGTVVLVRTCTKLAPVLGSVFLNSSRASSSFSSLMVSARATSSSERVLERSSHSLSLVAQLFSSSAKNFWSSRRAASVSERSSFICTIWTPSSPICLVLASTEALSAATSLAFAAIRDS
mmetsp:Transcript_13074/g.38123  ORF Transcript_13074/g.38123 Transcript_13074/m.38123 type:complete len:233 (+) Transcript_13074:811-1509(+)